MAASRTQPDQIHTDRDRRRDEAMRFLEERIDYERLRLDYYQTLDERLDVLRRVLARLGDPQRRLRTIHVAGTKGKGSVTAMLESILLEAGYRVACFTSPHLYSLTERFRVDGIPCDMDDCVDFLLGLQRRFAAWTGSWADEAAGLSYFDLLTIVALEMFAERDLDFAIFEVGMGGRFDSTNVCDPVLSLMTSIGFDHMEHLGNTLEEIAYEKAGIVRAGIPVVSGVRLLLPREVIRRMAEERKSPLYELGTDFRIVSHLEDIDSPTPEKRENPANSSIFACCVDYQWTNSQNGQNRTNKENDKIRKNGQKSDVVSDRETWNVLSRISFNIPGEHQLRNASLAVTAARVLREQGFRIPDDAMRKGLSKVRLPLRIEEVHEFPRLILDGAHNRSSAEALAEVIRSKPCHGRRFLVFGVMLEKDVDGMLEVLLPLFDRTIFTRSTKNPRAFPPIGLATIAAVVRGYSKSGSMDILPPLRDLRGDTVENPLRAFEIVWRLAKPEDLVCVTGSFYLAAEIREHFLSRR